MFEQQTQIVVKALEELGAALGGGLFSRLAEANRPLRAEAEEQAAKGKVLRESHEQLMPRINAQARILAGEKDTALAAGRDDDAEEKQQEREALTANLQAVLTEADGCEANVRELERQQRDNYRGIFEAVYPAIRQSTVAVEAGLVQLLDRVWADLEQYGLQSGLMGSTGVRPLVRSDVHKPDLTAREFGEERILFFKLVEWFGGRVR